VSKPFCVKFPIQDLNYILLLFFRMVVNKRLEFLLSFNFFIFPSITNEFLRKDIEPTPITNTNYMLIVITVDYIRKEIKFTILDLTKVFSDLFYKSFFRHNFWILFVIISRILLINNTDEFHFPLTQLFQSFSERIKQGFQAAGPVRPLTIRITRALNNLFICRSTWLRLIQILETFSAILTAAQAVVVGRGCKTWWACNIEKSKSNTFINTNISSCLYQCYCLSSHFTIRYYLIFPQKCKSVLYCLRLLR